MTVLRLIADDLTGALDTAAEFCALAGTVPVRCDACTAPGSLAIATGTREASRDAAFARVAEAAPLLTGADIAFKKLDSLLRGQPAAELAACLQGGAWRSVVLAPAFPAMGRVTRDGVQYAREADAWRQVATMSALLGAEDLAWHVGDATAPLPSGIVVFDAESDADLAAIVACGRAAPGPVLWCGSGGLGLALAAATPVLRDAALRGPVLGLFGSDQAVTRRQLAACGPLWIETEEAIPANRVAAALEARGAALVSLALPDVTRAVAAQRIARSFAALVNALPPPGTLLVAGGETLFALCAALGVQALVADGVVAPGVPRSTLRGGRWDGVAVVSKSGAFGADHLWRDLLAENGFIAEPQTT